MACSTKPYKTDGLSASNLDGLVAHFIRTRRKFARGEVQHFAKLPTLEAAVRAAASCCLPTGKRHSHQYRIPRAALEAAERALQQHAALLQAAQSFDELHTMVSDIIIGQIDGIAELTVYDIAHRIGAFLKLEPRLVYLHRGTAKGARELGFRGQTVEVSQLPKAFHRLSAAELEDCLCIYKDDIRVERLGRTFEASHCIRKQSPVC